MLKSKRPPGTEPDLLGVTADWMNLEGWITSCWSVCDRICGCREMDLALQFYYLLVPLSYSKNQSYNSSAGYTDQ